MAENSHQGNSTENWKDIPGYEGLYQISSHGHIKTYPRHYVSGPGYSTIKFLPEQSLKIRVNNKGYKYIILANNSVRKSYLIHRLLMLTFVPNPNNNPVINHINGIKSDNRLSNLEWCTRAHNIQHAVATGLKKTRMGAMATHTRKIIQLDLNGNFIKEWGCIQDAVNALNISRSSICFVLVGKRKKSCGYKWQYKN